MSEPTWQHVSGPPPPPLRTDGPTVKDLRAERSSRPAGSRRTQSPPRSSPPSGRTGGSKPATPTVDLTERINGFFQGNVAAPLFGAGLAFRNRALIADSEVIAQHGPELATEVNNLAQDNPQIAMIAERITRMGPYGMLFQILLKIAGKIATNHRQQLLPITSKMFQAKSLDEIVGTQESLDEQLRAMFASPATTSPNGQG